MTLNLTQSSQAQWCYTDNDGQPHFNVVAVRAFPLSAPDLGVSVVSSTGSELAWVNDTAQLDHASRKRAGQVFVIC